MTRWWEREIEKGSRTMYPATLHELGGVRTIVERYLGDTLDALSREEKELAAEAFRYMVTSAGRKIAQTVSELAASTYISEQASREMLDGLLDKLQKTRVLASVPPPRGSGPAERCFEFAHDVIAKAAFEWRKQFRQAQESAEAERKAAEQARESAILQLTRDVHQSMLPRQLPSSSYFELKATSLASGMVGGDYYDVLSLPDDRLGIAVADVSGKGLPAAFMATRLQGIFAVVALRDPRLEDLFHNVNDLLCERGHASMYATLFYGVLSPSGQFSYVNAGNPPALIVRANNTVHSLPANNLLLGWFPGSPFSSASIDLDHEDCLVIFSDGITEALDADDQSFGEDRLIESLKGCARKGAAEVTARIMAEVNAFRGEAPQSDDLTLVVIRFTRPRRD